MLIQQAQILQTGVGHFDMRVQGRQLVVYIFSDRGVPEIHGLVALAGGLDCDFARELWAYRQDTLNLNSCVLDDSVVSAATSMLTASATSWTRSGRRA